MSQAPWMVLIAAILAGCAQQPAQDSNMEPPGDFLPSLSGFGRLEVASAPAFAAPVLLDTVRAGGEPVIAVTHAGTILVASHPGFTHYHGGGDPTTAADLVTPFAGQSYIFRSTDNGTTWSVIGLPLGGGGEGPRSAGLGVSDPEFTVMEDGAICFTDLEALVSASTSCSLDDGLTWNGNPVSSGGPVDRQWLASYKDEFYFTASGAPIRVSTDKGLTWESRGAEPCGSDMVANPANGHLYQSCGGTAIAVSTDGGFTFETRGPKQAKGSALILNEPAVDAAGNVWITWSDAERNLWVAGTPDEGLTWPWAIDLGAQFRFYSGMAPCHGAGPDCGTATDGSFVWPWVSAGSDGRLAVSWIGSFGTTPSESYDGPWFVFSAFVLGADTDAPTVVVERLTPEPIHVGPICQGGTGCEATSVTGDPGGDRRLGDFFETTIEPGTGYLLAAFGNTAARPSDAIGHPMFVRQTAGVRLIADAELGSFRPTQG